MTSLSQCQTDIKQNKIKQGSLIKRSRILKQWKQRWMVLTKTHLYSFSQKGVYKNPTQTVSLNTIQTLKSYYKDQYQKPWIFRIQSPDVNIYLSAKNDQQKWSWMTAIQKMTNKLCSKNNKVDTYNHIRQSIKMTSAFRQSISNQKQKIGLNQTADKFNQFMKCQRIMNLTKNNYVIDIFIPPPPKQVINIKILKDNLPFDQTFDLQKTTTHERKRSFFLDKKGQQKMTIAQHLGDISFSTSAIQFDQKQKIVQKIIEKQRVIYVPQVRQKIVEKIVYVNENDNSLNSPLNKSRSSIRKQPSAGLYSILINICSVKCQKNKPFVNFVTYLLTQKFYNYHQDILDFCLKSNQKEYFSQLVLLSLNQQPQQDQINIYLKFITNIYQTIDDYFHSSDIKVLIDILLRQLSMSRSQLNQFLIINLFKVLSDKIWWKKSNYRKNQLYQFVKVLQKTGNHQVQYVSSELLSRI